jgi:cysteine-rich repeat protein
VVRYIYKEFFNILYMKRKSVGLLLFCSIMIFVLMMQIVIAHDVAYVYRSHGKIDWKIVNVFENMGLSVRFVNEWDINKLHHFKLIFVGDEKYRNYIPINKYNTIVSSRHFGGKWGLTDRDGISQLAANDFLKVLKFGEVKQVYKQATFKLGGVSIPYYYLDKNNKADSVHTIAGAFKGSFYEILGDVIGFVYAGDYLENGRKAYGNICYFGIVHSKYWTPEVYDMFEFCVNHVKPAICGDELIEDEEECDDGNSDDNDFCTNECIINICGDGILNEIDEQCDDGNTEDGDGCSSMCEDETILIHDVALVEFTNSVGGIRLEHTNGTDILDNILSCNQKYKVAVTVENLGNFTENITFIGSVDGIEIDHLPKDDLAPTTKSLKTRTINFTLDAGFYSIVVESIIDIDDVPENNFATRDVEIICTE